MSNLRKEGRGLALALAMIVVTTASGQNVRIATWNVSLFTGTNRVEDIKTALFASGPAGAMNPDVLLAQEIQSTSAATTFLNALNAVQPNSWAVSFGTPLNGTSNTNDTAVFYKTGKVNLAQAPVRVAAAGGTSGQPRDTWRFDFSIVDNALSSERIALYNVHMKAGSTADDQARRQLEAQAIRSDAANLNSNYHFLVGGDFNVQSSSQQAYQTLVGSGTGQFRDPISTTGNWSGNSAFRFVHTQDPATQMDDRHDQLLLSNSLVDGIGTDYVGSFGTAYSTTTWNDPNHSYRVWGNDGGSFGGTLRTTGNTMVGPTIAQALINAATPSANNPGGHLPVFLDVSYTPVPEPASMAALGLGVLALLRRKKR